ncbi:MAG TPA: BrnT family toxin [Burkholderiales bacterium]|nr:BrnT family toxin [Burkholderiales bacterium]
MKVGWDEAKRRTNLRKHGLNFADAEEAHEQTLYFENI